MTKKLTEQFSSQGYNYNLVISSQNFSQVTSLVQAEKNDIILQLVHHTTPY
jgi:hypothetical protein